jgi:tape measure domain-containing protein
MAVTATLVARYQANIVDFDRELKRLQALNARAAQNIANQHQQAARGANRAWANSNIGGALNRSLGAGLGSLRTELMASIAAIASGAGIAAAIALADTYARFTNSLKVAGVEGAALETVQKRLYEGAIRNGVELESLGQLYGRVASASTELGVSQEQILRVTDAVSAAIRVSGGTAASSSGAMLQMAQALGAGTVRAEEFNSMTEGMLPLLQAAAGASTKYGGSVAKMRTDVLAGKLSSKEFFDLIIAGSASLEAKAARAPLTVAQSYTNLSTSLIKFMGDTDASLGVTRRLSEALALLANNLDVVANSLGVIVVALSVALAPAIGRAAIGLGSYAAATAGSLAANIAHTSQLVAKTAGIYGVSRAAAVATISMRALMSATGIGLAITAITVALGAFALQSAKAAETNRELKNAVDEYWASIEAKRKAEAQARVETGALTTEQKKVLSSTASLTGEVNLLATAWGRVAAEAKRAALEQMRAKLKTLETAETAARDKYDRRVRRAQDSYASGLTSTARTGILPAQRPADVIAKSEEATELRRASGAVAGTRAEIAAEEKRKLAEYRPPAPAVASPKGGGRGGSGGKSAVDIARNSAEAVERAERELAEALRALATTGEDRHRVALEALIEERDANIRAIEQRAQDGEITQAAAEKLVTLEGQTYLAKKEAETARRAEEIAANQAEISELRTQQAADALQVEADELSAKAELATTLAEKQEYERQALAKTQAADDLLFAAQQEATRLQLTKNGHAKADIEAYLADKQRTRDRVKAGETSGQATDQKGERGPGSLEEWIAELARAESAGRTFNASLFDIAKGGLDAIASGITDAIMGAQDFKEAFADMAKAVIAQLVEMAIKFLIFEALGRAFGVPGMGRMAIGLPASGSGPKVGSNATGTRFWRGGPTAINEKGDEIITLPTGSQVIPHSVVRQAMKVTGSRAAPVQQFTNHIVVDARDAVLTSSVKGWIQEANIQAMLATKQQMARDNMASARNRLGR